MISPITEKILYDKNGLQIRSGTPDVVKINSKIDKKVEGMIKVAHGQCINQQSCQFFAISIITKLLEIFQN